MRHILPKTMTYGAMHLAITFCVAWFVSGDIRVAAAISMLEPCVQVLFFSLHEYAWSRRNPGIPSPHKDCCASRGGLAKVLDFMSKKRA